MARGFEVTTGLVIRQGIWEQSATAYHRIGTRMQLVDGRVFFYSSAGASALAPGKLNFGSLALVGHERLAPTATAAIGATSIGLTMATTKVAVTNFYAEGYLIGAQTAGVGQCLKIKSHSPASCASGATMLFNLYDPLNVAITTAAKVGVVPNPFKAVVENATSTVGNPAGVPLIVVTAAYYFWNQTWGMAAVLNNAAIPTGSMVVPGATAGSVKEMATSSATLAGYDDAIVGVGVNVGSAATYSAVFLKLHC